MGGAYWSSTTYPFSSNTFRAYDLEALVALVTATQKTLNQSVRAVRGG
jgi:hypothetical protein